MTPRPVFLGYAMCGCSSFRVDIILVVGVAVSGRRFSKFPSSFFAFLHAYTWERRRWVQLKFNDVFRRSYLLSLDISTVNMRWQKMWDSELSATSYSGFTNFYVNLQIFYSKFGNKVFLKIRSEWAKKIGLWRSNFPSFHKILRNFFLIIHNFDANFTITSKDKHGNVRFVLLKRLFWWFQISVQLKLLIALKLRSCYVTGFI